MKTFLDKLEEGFAIGILFYGAFVFFYGIPTMLYEDYMTTKNSNAVANCTPEPRYWDSPNTYIMNCEIIIK